MDEYGAVIEELRGSFPDMELIENAAMSKHTSFKIGGPARLMALPRSVRETQAAIRAAQSHGIISYTIGNGTNILVPDEGLDAFIIKTCPGLGDVAIEGSDIIAGAGTLLSRVAAAAQKSGLRGLEFAHGIPGSLGGAVTMNAGAYGGEIKDVVLDVEYIDLAGELCSINAEGLQFGYRRSVFSDNIGIITGVRLRLESGDPEQIRAEMEELSRRRRGSQPLDIPSAGSTFKRPAGDFAARLIDEAGLKGLRVGGAQVSEKHAGFIVNTGGATAADVLELIGRVRDAVFKKSGIELEPEVKLLGKR